MRAFAARSGIVLSDAFSHVNGSGPPVEVLFFKDNAVEGEMPLYKHRNEPVDHQTAYKTGCPSEDDPYFYRLSLSFREKQPPVGNRVACFRMRR